MLARFFRRLCVTLRDEYDKAAFQALSAMDNAI